MTTEQAKAKHTWKVGKPHGLTKVEIEGQSATPGRTVLIAVCDPRNAPLISAAPDLFAALADIIDGAPTEEELSGVQLKPRQQIKLSLLIDSAKIRTARAAIAKATKGGTA